MVGPLGDEIDCSKTKNLIVSRSRTIDPQPPALTSGITVLKESDDLVMFSVIFYSNMT